MANEIDKAIKLARQMRLLLIRVVGLEKENEQEQDDYEEYEASDEIVDDFFKEASTNDVPAVGLLSKIDQLIYDLMDYQGGGDGWVDADGFDSKEMLKLKEIVSVDEHKKLNQAIKYIEHAKDQLYDYVADDDYAKKQARRFFPIDHFLKSIRSEGKEMAHSDALKIIKTLDDIIFTIVGGTTKSKKKQKYLASAA